MTDISAEMRAFGASEEACTNWPDDTPEHRALRAAFIAGAAASAPPVVHRIAEIAEAVGFQAGVGGMEIAGTIISCLAEKQELVERFLRDGTALIVSGEISAENGRLTFHRHVDGKVTTPQELRIAKQVRAMERNKSP